VVLDITTSQVELGVDVGELAEDILWALAHDVGQHVEPSAMGHRQDDLANALIAGFFDRKIQQRNQAFCPFQ
jgi:hypothetical protein